MKGHAGRTTSVWMSTARMPPRSALATDAACDVVIVGAGIAGLTTAYLLAREKKSVVVLDDGPICGGETERTTAHLSNAFDDRYVEVEKMLGEDVARQVAQSHTTAIDTIEDIIEREGIDCGFERLDGFLFTPPGEDTKILLDELEACRRAGLLDVELVKRAPMPLFDTGTALRFPRQAQFHPLKYLRALVGAIERMGGRVFAYTHVASVTGGPVPRVKTSDGRTVTGETVVVATNTPVIDRVTMHTKQAAYRTYVVAARVAGPIEKALFWDTQDPYHYVRLAQHGEDAVLVVGGEDHRTGQAHDAVERWARLEAWARERFPIGEVTTRWSGQVMEPFDGLAFIGKNPGDENVLIATGDSGMGMTHGTIAGLLLSDLALGQDHAWAKIYDPARKPVHSIAEYAKENLNIVAQYADWIAPGDVPSVDEIPQGQGAVVRRGLALVAVYVDEQGRRHECSAVCPHLGGIVSFNPVEKTWDCPVHGSRFECTGNVLNGPANKGLAREEPVKRDDPDVVAPGDD
jgi:glycine/D-amino acid oxidase-like deaminating enzyme/nitrite reductase/ring-hydroxylating ferredoxin subunit